MAIDNLFSYIESFTNIERGLYDPRQFRLDRMRKLLDFFEHPEENFASTHIAGSKGKGSTAVFLASILAEAGHKTGLYTSPHISSYTERFRILRGPPSKDTRTEKALEALIAEIRARVGPSPGEQGREKTIGPEDPSTFELLTCLGFLLFAREQCSKAVIETGLGGRLDATNVIQPEICIITPIELEHTEYLGNSIEEIAGEKAGIIKEGVTVFSSAQREAAGNVLEKSAREKSAQILFPNDYLKDLKSEVGLSATHCYIKYHDGMEINCRLRLLGSFQAENAGLAGAAAKTLIPWLPAGVIERGLSSAFIPGRMEILSSNPLLILDSAHTIRSVERSLDAFLASIKESTESGILIFGSVQGKDYQGMAKVLAASFDHIIISRPGTFKPSEPSTIFEAFKKLNPNTHLIEGPEEALAYALEKSNGEKPVLITGSFYLAGGIRNAWAKRH